MYNNKGYHSQPVFLNAMDNAVLRHYLPHNGDNRGAYGKFHVCCGIFTVLCCLNEWEELLFISRHQRRELSVWKHWLFTLLGIQVDINSIFLYLFDDIHFVFLYILRYPSCVHISPAISFQFLCLSYEMHLVFIFILRYPLYVNVFILFHLDVCIKSLLFGVCFILYFSIFFLIWYFGVFLRL